MIPWRLASVVSDAWQATDGNWPLRLALAPLARVYGGAVRVRNAAYDRGILPRDSAPIPVVSVGNLSVGGTGKTPVAAALARRLADLGHRPAIVLRGYGEDETLLHANLNPDVPIFVGADRLDIVRRVAASGFGVAVLDDGFQHRRLIRDLDIVLVSADAFVRTSRSLLPSGPYREPLRSARRADLVLVTRKSVSRTTAGEVATVLGGIVHGVPVSLVEVRPDGVVPLREPGAAPTPLARLQGESVVAVSSIADPLPFHRALEAAGATVEPLAFADHYPYSDRDASRIARLARGRRVVTTGKDAVKLRAVNLEEMDVIVVRQRVRFEDPAQLDRLLEEVSRAG